MTTQSFLDHMRGLRGYAGQIIHVERLPAREPRKPRM